MQAENLFVLEWSKQQNCLHIQPAMRTLKEHLKCFFKDEKPNDYHVLVIGTRAECEEVASRVRKTIVARDIMRKKAA